MAGPKMKVGNRVTVLDPEDSEAKTGDGFPVSKFVGKRGGIVAMRDDGMVLVDDQYTSGDTPQGSCTMREWFKPEHLEVG